MTPTLPWWLVGEGVKTTENKYIGPVATYTVYTVDIYPHHLSAIAPLLPEKSIPNK